MDNGFGPRPVAWFVFFLPPYGVVLTPCRAPPSMSCMSLYECLGQIRHPCRVTASGIMISPELLVATWSRAEPSQTQNTIPNEMEEVTEEITTVKKGKHPRIEVGHLAM